jgi:Domain of unknown function (DUF397)
VNYQQALASLERVTAGRWRKSRHSDEQANCVEITTAIPGWVGLRDTKLGDNGPIHAYTIAEFRAFVASAKDGEFDI